MPISLHVLLDDDSRIILYFTDFETRFWQVDCTWKLELRQVFQEPDAPSWVAMAEGDRRRSLVLADEMRDGIAEHQRRLDKRGIVQRCVRIVELPLSDYLWWELHVLRIRAEIASLWRRSEDLRSFLSRTGVPANAPDTG